jgi:hypothetical protein
MAIQIQDGNAFSIIAAGTKELKRQGRREEIGKFTEESMSGDYDNVIATLLRWFPDEDVEI